MPNLHKANANYNLRQPIGDLLQVGVGSVLRAPFKWSRTLHCAWDSEQEPHDPAREVSGTCYY